MEEMKEDTAYVMYKAKLIGKILPDLRVSFIYFFHMGWRLLFGDFYDLIFRTIFGKKVSKLIFRILICGWVWEFCASNY